MSSPLFATFKRKFITGLFVSIPAVITILIIGKFVSFVDSLLEPVYYNILGYHTQGLGFVSAIIIVFVIGILSTNVFGKRIINFFEQIFINIPVFKGFYTAVKHLVDAFSPDNKSVSFKKFVIIEYPRPGLYAFGFLTKECTVRSAKDGKQSCLRAIYVPTNNLYLGEIVLASEGDVYYTDIPIEEGIKIILSGGIAAPNVIRETTG